ncbi:MAG TPA: class I SAM-dependent methyltransferase [Anaerolineales bacterium]
MLKRIADNREAGSLAVQFRRKRFAFFQSLLSQLERPVHILDIGGTALYWDMMGLNADDQVRVTVLNLTQDSSPQLNITSIVGDARKIEAEDKSFDIVFSNSVIEHVGTFQDQVQMAAEVRRVGSRYFVQTPNKYFPLEPHFLFPFFQFLPLSIRVKLLQNFNLGWFRKTPDVHAAREIVESIRLLSRGEFLRLFPGANLYEEKVLGMTKSFVAYQGWNTR